MRRYLLSLIAVGLWPTLTFAQTTTQVVEYYHTDALGSVRAVTKVVNGQTQVVSRHDYRPFGEEVASQNPPVDKRLFTGKERDQETGLDYFGARYLRTDLGRFTNPDPLMSSGHPADPQSWTRYTYAKNNPLRFIDFFGLYVWEPSNCKSGDKACQKQYEKNQREFRRALDALMDIANDGGDGSVEAMSALSVYGSENGDNGISVGFRPLGPNVGATVDPAGDQRHFRVWFNSQDAGRNVNLSAVYAAHEARHISDFRSGRSFGFFAQEFRALWASSLISQYLREDTEWWNRSWRLPDMMTLRQNGIVHSIMTGRYRQAQAEFIVDMMKLNVFERSIWAWMSQVPPFR